MKGGRVDGPPSTFNFTTLQDTIISVKDNDSYILPFGGTDIAESSYDKLYNTERTYFPDFVNILERPDPAKMFNSPNGITAADAYDLDNTFQYTVGIFGNNGLSYANFNEYLKTEKLLIKSLTFYTNPNTFVGAPIQKVPVVVSEIGLFNCTLGQFKVDKIPLTTFLNPVLPDTMNTSAGAFSQFPKIFVPCNFYIDKFNGFYVRFNGQLLYQNFSLTTQNIFEQYGLGLAIECYPYKKD